MTTESRSDLRGRGTAATIEGAFAALWFTWAGPAPGGFAAALRAGAVLALLTAGVGAVVTWRNRHQPTALHDPDKRRQFRRIAAVEFGALAAGAVMLGATGQGRWVPVWALTVVGAHFVPLGRAVGNRLMRLLGLLLIGTAAAGLTIGLATPLAPALVAGPIAGAGLVFIAVVTLAGGARRSGDAPAVVQVAVSSG